MYWGALVIGASGALTPFHGGSPEKLGPPLPRLHPSPL